MTSEYSGLRATNQKYLPNSVGYWEAVSESASKGQVIPYLIPPRSQEADAWNVRVDQLFNAGLIPRIYSLIRHSRGMDVPDILSRLKDSGMLISETFSVVSHAPTRTLISYLSSKETDGSPKGSPSTPTTSDDTFPDVPA